MSAARCYVAITPVRNEERYLPQTIQSFVTQKCAPIAWIIVDDGSTDATGSIADAAAAHYPWIEVVHRPDRGFRQPGTGVMEAFSDGLARLGSTAWDFLAKLDADLVFSPDYFASCLERFEHNPRLGIGGGLICRRRGDTLIPDSASDPLFHVRGATKIYRRACWDQIGGLIKEPGWDTIDELKANMLGWTTRTFTDLQVQQLKETGSADGRWRNWVKNGRANYITGYHPIFMVCKCAKRLLQKPFGIAGVGLLFGFASGYLEGIPQLPDRELVRFIRREQLRKLTFRRSLWTA